MGSSSFLSWFSVGLPLDCLMTGFQLACQGSTFAADFFGCLWRGANGPWNWAWLRTTLVCQACFNRVVATFISHSFFFGNKNGFQPDNGISWWWHACTAHMWCSGFADRCTKKSWVRHVLTTEFLNMPIGHTKILRLIVKFQSISFRVNMGYLEIPRSMQSWCNLTWTKPAWDVVWCLRITAWTSEISCGFWNFLEKSVHI